MRELKVVGLDVDGKRIICESDDSKEKFILRADDRLRAAVRGDKPVASSAARERSSSTGWANRSTRATSTPDASATCSTDAPALIRA